MWPRPRPRTPCPGGYEIYNVGRPFLVHHYHIIRGFSIRKIREHDFITKYFFQFYTFHPKISPFGVGADRVHEIYNLLCPFNFECKLVFHKQTLAFKT